MSPLQRIVNIICLVLYLCGVSGIILANITLFKSGDLTWQVVAGYFVGVQTALVFYFIFAVIIPLMKKLSQKPDIEIPPVSFPVDRYNAAVRENEERSRRNDV